MSEPCTLNEPPFFQCCCNCKNHWQDNHHCTTADDLRTEKGSCVCGVPKGWACVVFKLMDPVEGMIHSGWPEHSTGCECYTPAMPDALHKGGLQHLSHICTFCGISRASSRSPCEFCAGTAK